MPEKEAEEFDVNVDSLRSLPQELPTHEQLIASITVVIACRITVGSRIGAGILKSVVMLRLASDMDVSMKTGAAIGRRVERIAAILPLVYWKRIIYTKPKVGLTRIIVL